MAVRAKEVTKLAMDGGRKAVKSLTPSDMKIGIDDIMEVLDLWKVSRKGADKIKAILEKESLINPTMFRYYNPRSKVEKAEKAFAAKIGTKYALAVNSGTSALIAAYVALGVGPGTEVIVPGFTFFATAAAAVVAKAVPVIAEIDDSFNLDPNDVARKITPQTKAIAAVHMVGTPADMDPIMEIAREHNLKVIEDCAQADGTSYKGRRVGSIGDCGCFSLDYYKIITSGEGGFMTTNDELAYIRAQSYHDTAACWRPDRYARERVPGELFCGENYRMSELQGAVALAQIRRMDKKMSAWRRNKKRIMAGIEKFPGLGFQRVPDPEGEAGFSLTMLYPTAELAVRAIDALVAEGVPAGGRKDKTVRDWHIYSYWEHILEQKTPTPEGCPFTCHVRFGGKLPEYSPDMCPKTIDYLHRSVRVSIGENYSKEECDSIALGINKVNESLLGQGQSN